MNAHTPIFIHTSNLHLHFSQPSDGAALHVDMREVGIDLAAAPKREVRVLGGGERISQEQALKELAALGQGWRLETPHELFALVDYSQKNQLGAYTRDPDLKDGYYWTSQETPWYEGGRVVVGFNYGFVDGSFAYGRAFARAVRVAGQ